MKEKDVKERVKTYFEKEGYTVLKEFGSSKGRVDLVAFKQLDEYELDSAAVECKGESTIKGVYKIIQAQVVEYQKCFPKVYVATVRPPRKAIETIKEICRVNSVGYISVAESEVKVELHPPSLNPVLKRDLYRIEVRPFPIILSAFRELFGPDNIRWSQGYVWCSTKGEVQYWVEIHLSDNHIPHSLLGDVVFGINIENSRKILAEMDEQVLYSSLKSIPQYSAIWVQKEKFFGRGLRVRMDVLSKFIADLTPSDIGYLLNLSKTEAHSLHLDIYSRVWHVDEIVSKNEYGDRLRRAKEHIEKLYDFFVRSR